MFLTCGEIEYDDKFVDPRTLSVSAAYNFAHSEHLLVYNHLHCFSTFVMST